VECLAGPHHRQHAALGTGQAALRLEGTFGEKTALTIARSAR
jgi:hypothetical protein